MRECLNECMSSPQMTDSRARDSSTPPLCGAGFPEQAEEWVHNGSRRIWRQDQTKREYWNQQAPAFKQSKHRAWVLKSCYWRWQMSARSDFLPQPHKDPAGMVQGLGFRPTRCHDYIPRSSMFEGATAWAWVHLCLSMLKPRPRSPCTVAPATGAFCMSAAQLMCH